MPNMPSSSSSKIFDAQRIVLASFVGVIVSVAIGNIPNSLETVARSIIASVFLYVLVELYVEHRINDALLQYREQEMDTRRTVETENGVNKGLPVVAEERKREEEEVFDNIKPQQIHKNTLVKSHVNILEPDNTTLVNDDNENISNNDKDDINNLESGINEEEENENEKEDEKEDEKKDANEEKKTHEEEPEELLCPILQSLMADPVITEDGFTYERSAIEHWLKDHDTSPKTGKKLKNKTLIPNHILRGQLQDYRKKHNLPPALLWQPPPLSENSTDSPTGSNYNDVDSNNNNNIRIDFNNGVPSVTIQRQGNSTNNNNVLRHPTTSHSHNTNNNNNQIAISDMLNESQLQVLYGTTSNILDQHPFLLQDLQLNGVNGLPLTINVASRVIVHDPNLWNSILPYILSNEEAKIVVQPILSIMDRVQRERHSHNSNNSQQAASRNNYRNIHPIFEAVLKDDVRAMQRMLPSTVTGHNSWPGVEVWPLNGKTPDGISLLHFACREGKIQCVSYLLTLNINVNEVDRIRSTPLHLASFFGRTEIVRRLLEYKKDGNARCDPNKHMMNGDTALHQASWNGHIDVMKLLLQYNAKPNATKEDGSTPLQLAAIRNQCNTVNFLLGNGALGTKADVNGNLPIHAAAAKGCEHSIEFLSTAAPETINALNNAGEAPIHIATWFGNVSNLNAIISCYKKHVCKTSLSPINEKESDITHIETLSVNKLIEVKRQSDGATPLCLAILRGRVSLVKLFLQQYNANVYMCLSKDHETPLHLAAAHNSSAHTEILKLLLHNKATKHQKEMSINAKMRDAFTPLLVAIAKNCLNNVEVLLKHGANVSCQSGNGTTALMLAIETGSVACLRILLKFIDDTYKDSQKSTIINRQRGDGKTALHLGSYCGKIEIVEELLNYEADPFLKNVGGVLPIEIAQQMNHNVIFGMLERYMNRRKS
jgi:ankyrin repeat protein